MAIAGVQFEIGAEGFRQMQGNAAVAGFDSPIGAEFCPREDIQGDGTVLRVEAQVVEAAADVDAAVAAVGVENAIHTIGLDTAIAGVGANGTMQLAQANRAVAGMDVGDQVLRNVDFELDGVVAKSEVRGGHLDVDFDAVAVLMFGDANAGIANGPALRGERGVDGAAGAGLDND